MSDPQQTKRSPSTAMSFLVFGIAIAFLLFGVVVLEYDIHIILLIDLVFICLMSATLGYSFNDLVECMKKTLGQSMSAMIIFIFIGIIVASWIFSGTVPTLIYYGLQYLTPKFFLPLGLILCSVVSLSIGTSWGTLGTMGLAMMGIGAGMGIPAPLTAGMVISGSFFGDKMSPMSDTTNLAPAASGTTLYEHINAMWQTTIPAYIITLVLFTIIGLSYQSGDVDQSTIALFSETLAGRFVIHPVLLVPVVVLLALNLLHFPAIPGMVLGSLLAVILACVVQGTPLKEVILGLNYGYVEPTGVDLVDTLLLRGGVQGMMYTFSLSCIAISFGGVLEQVGYLHKIIEVVVSRVKSDRLMVPLVIASTTLGNVSMGEVYLSIVVNGNLYREAFQERGIRLNMLSRLLEEGGTLTQVFVPWSTSGVFIAATLGVTAGEYWKFALFNYINPLLSIVLALFGVFILYDSEHSSKKKNRGGKGIC
ncbi:Na+/H+ antiporter NhaC [Intestinimonas sp.]|uniref:Na+/H+ antiporter NhaC n=1 Tax=Intestinimonas sp. TaxID=1965293 RepID=UPI00260D15D0|nr:Na+/H+ antiporter NhaC [Intestinimonas sp.]